MLKALKLLAKELMSYDNHALSKALSAGALKEVKHDG